MEPELKIAIVQLRTDEGSQVENQFRQALDVLGRVEQCDMIVLPELWLQGAFGSGSEQSSPLELPNDYLNFLIDWAKNRKTWVCSGSFLTMTNAGGITNTCFMINPNGIILSSYSKRHLFGHGSNEAQRLVPGINRAELDTRFGKVGFAICYDLRFPEHFRNSVAIPEIFLIPSAWPENRIQHFLKLAVGRAVENQCYIIACNGIGKQGDIVLGGNSLVVDYEGITQLRLSNEEEIGYCILNLDKLRVAREEFAVLNDRILD